MKRPETDFGQMYAGPPPPWDIGRSQAALADILEQITGPVLDAGCGTGEHALAIAARGVPVLGIDFEPKAISAARRKAQERGIVMARFEVRNALELDALGERFASVVDCGLFHVFDDEPRARYASALHRVISPGGTLYLLCFSDAEPPGRGPRRVSESELRTTFAEGWTIARLEPSRYEVRPEAIEELGFTPGGPHAWLLVATRTTSEG